MENRRSYRWIPLLFAVPLGIVLLELIALKLTGNRTDVAAVGIGLGSAASIAGVRARVYTKCAEPPTAPDFASLVMGPLLMIALMYDLVFTLHMRHAPPGISDVVAVSFSLLIGLQIGPAYMTWSGYLRHWRTRTRAVAP